MARIPSPQDRTDALKAAEAAIEHRQGQQPMMAFLPKNYALSPATVTADEFYELARNTVDALRDRGWNCPALMIMKYPNGHSVAAWLIGERLCLSIGAVTYKLREDDTKDCMIEPTPEAYEGLVALNMVLHSPLC